MMKQSRLTEMMPHFTVGMFFRLLMVKRSFAIHL